ncbi:MAG: energy transducer TonB [Bacteroidota bacterium]
MKKLVALLLPLIFTLGLSAQAEEVLRLVEQMPRFPGCEDIADETERRVCSEKELINFLSTNLKYPAFARRKCVEGVCVVVFTVEKDGSISDIDLVRDIGAGCGQESTRVVQEMVNQNIVWIPGTHEGETVRVRFTLPIKFLLEKGKTKKGFFKRLFSKND